MSFESPVVKSFIAGSFSGTVSAVLFQPLDLLKTRIQSGQTNTLYGTSHCNLTSLNLISKILQNENLFALWKGITPSVARCVPGVGIYFSSLHWLKNYIEIDTEPTAAQAILLGMGARSISAVCLIPMTVVKTRIESGQFSYSSMSAALVQIHKREGLRGLTCGLLPTLFRDAPFSGLYLMFYTQLKKCVSEDLKNSDYVSLTNFTCGTLAGLSASVVTQPADVLKTKMQLYPKKFDTVFHVAVYVHKKHGLQGYFKGLGPRLMRRTLMAAMAWTIYEKLIISLGLK
ncbi:mitochondrial glycine transporter-like isoform X2 [Lycorma delicatula]|uniref:mitochondrial glycine transporter-like isoform X2 n=1 Tax=Lycorma delicatula TaxID=130591 RepID=UPI003F5191AE